MVNVQRKKGETFESLLRRFTRRMQLSGTILQAKKYRFHARTPNRTKKQASALRRLEVKEKREYLLKTGQLIEEAPRGRRR